MISPTSPQYLSSGNIPRILAPKSQQTCMLLARTCCKSNLTIFKPPFSCTSSPTHQFLANQLVQIPHTRPLVCSSHSIFALLSSTLIWTAQVGDNIYLLPRRRYQLDSHKPKQWHCPCQGLVSIQFTYEIQICLALCPLTKMCPPILLYYSQK